MARGERRSGGQQSAQAGQAGSVPGAETLRGLCGETAVSNGPGPGGRGAGWGAHLGPRTRPAPPSGTARSSPGCPPSPAWSTGRSVGDDGGHRAPGRTGGHGEGGSVRRGQSDVRGTGRGAGGAGPGRGTHVLTDERQDERFELIEALVDAGTAAFLQEGLECLRGEEAVRAARHRRRRFSCRPELTLRSSAGLRGGCGTAPGGDIALRRSGTANAFMSRRAAPPPGPVRMAERRQWGREAGRAVGR